MGFSWYHNSSPNYYYIDYNKNVLESRQKYQKHKLKRKLKLFDEKLSESDNMKMNGFGKIWDCGNSVWIYQKR